LIVSRPAPQLLDLAALVATTYAAAATLLWVPWRYLHAVPVERMRWLAGFTTGRIAVFSTSSSGRLPFSSEGCWLLLSRYPLRLSSAARSFRARVLSITAMGSASTRLRLPWFAGGGVDAGGAAGEAAGVQRYRADDWVAGPAAPRNNQPQLGDGMVDYMQGKD